MARFIQPQQQSVVQMYTPKNIEFYANILNKAQSDLERATAIKQQAIDKMGDLPFFTKEDRDATLGRVQELLKNATDADFVSPSRVSNAVMQANAEVMPGIHALKAKAKAADMYEKMQLAYGPNAWLSADPRQQSIVDPNTGRFVDPNRFKAVGINAEEVDKAFLASQLSTLTKPGELTWTRKGAPAGKILTRQTTGLSDSERENMYFPGKPTAIALAQEQLKSMPQLLDVFGGDTEKALQQLMIRNYQTSGAYKQDVQSNLVSDEAWEWEQRRAASTNSGGDPLPLFKPVAGDVQTTDVINDLLKSFIGDNSVGMSSNDVEFDKNGRLIQKKIPEDRAVANPYGQVVGYTGASTSRRIYALRRNTAMNKAITFMRKSLQASGMSVIRDVKTGKMRARTDEEVFNFYNQAAVNSANVFGRNFQIHPGLGIIGANGFFQPDGKRKDFRNMNIEIDRSDGKGWQPIDETSKFAEELGFNISTGKEAGEFNSVLKTLGDGVYDFMGGSAKIRTAVTDKDGKEISIRYDVTPEVSKYKRPIVELYSAFTKPIPMTKDEEGNMRGKVITVGADYKTGKPVYIEIASDFTVDRNGRPIIQPKVIGISQDTEAGVRYAQEYMINGYAGLLSIINTNTDEALIESQNVYINKSVNIKEVPNGE